MKDYLPKILRFFVLNKLIKHKEKSTFFVTAAIYVCIWLGLGVAKLMTGWIPLIGGLIYSVEFLYGFYVLVGIILAAVQCFGAEDYSAINYITLEDIKSIWSMRSGKIAILVALAVLCLIPTVGSLLSSKDKKQEETTVASAESELQKQDNSVEKEMEREEVSLAVEENAAYEEADSIDEEKNTEKTVEEMMMESDVSEDILIYGLPANEDDVTEAAGGIVEDNVQYYCYDNLGNTGELAAKAVISGDEFTLLEEIEYEGVMYPVTIFARSPYANYGGGEVEEYTIPEQFKYFETMGGLWAENLIFPDTVRYINLSEQPFGKNIKSVRFPEGLACYGTQPWVDTFMECEKLESMTIPEGTKELIGTFSKCKYLQEVKLPNSLEYIGTNCFLGCECIENVEIPKNVKRIGKKAFWYCKSLTEITLPDGLEFVDEEAFFGCEKLQTLVYPDSVTECYGKFIDMDGLKYIVFPKDANIDYYDFLGCKKLERIVFPDTSTEFYAYFPDNLKTIEVSEALVDTMQAQYPDIEVIARDSNKNYREEAALYESEEAEYITLDDSRSIGEIDIDGVKYTIYDKVGNTGEIGAEAEFMEDRYDTMLEEVEFEGVVYPVTIFGGCYDFNRSLEFSPGGEILNTEHILSEYTIPGHIKYISTMGQMEVINLTIPDTVEYIDWDSFNIGTQFESVVMPEWLECYGQYKWLSAFDGSENLKTMTIPDGVKELNSTFCDCTSLEEVTLPDTIAVLDSTFAKCRNLASISLPDNLVTLGRHTFYGCSSLTEITIPDGVKSIGQGCFDGCINLVSVTIPDSVEEIDDEVFYECASLTTVRLPKNLKKFALGKYTFDGCDSLEQVIVPEEISDEIFIELQERLPDVEIVRE